MKCWFLLCWLVGWFFVAWTHVKFFTYEANLLQTIPELILCVQTVSKRIEFFAQAGGEPGIFWFSFIFSHTSSAPSAPLWRRADLKWRFKGESFFPAPCFEPTTFRVRYFFALYCREPLSSQSCGILNIVISWRRQRRRQRFGYTTDDNWYKSSEL